MPCCVLSQCWAPTKIGVGGQAIWSDEDRLKTSAASGAGTGRSSAERGGGGLLPPWSWLSWLRAGVGIASSSGGSDENDRDAAANHLHSSGGGGGGGGLGGRDFFSHVNRGLAAALQDDHVTAVAEFKLATGLCNRSVELYVNLFEEQLAMLAEASARGGDPVAAELFALRNDASKTISTATDLTLAAMEDGAAARTGAAFLHRIGTAMVDAATKHRPPRWEPRAAFSLGEQLLQKAAQLAAASAEAPPSLLAGEIALVRVVLAVASDEWARAEVQLGLAMEHLGDEHVIGKLKLGRGPEKLLQMAHGKTIGSSKAGSGYASASAAASRGGAQSDDPSVAPSGAEAGGKGKKQRQKKKKKKKTAKQK